MFFFGFGLWQITEISQSYIITCLDLAIQADLNLANQVAIHQNLS
jgi:hypothetical protein